VGAAPHGDLRVDGVTILSLYLLFLFAIPSRLTFAPLGGGGSPAMLLGVGCAIFWVWYRLASHEPGPFIVQPVRRAAFFFFGALLASFAAGAARTISAEELRLSELALLGAVGWIGVVVMTCDGVISMWRLRTLLRRLSLAAGLFASLGLAQFFTSQPLTNLIVIPGLSLNQELWSLASREGFNRPASTALHAIEFGVAITALLPLCLHVALHEKGIGALRRWFPVAAIALAVPLSISRSAIIGAAVGLLVLIPTWAPRLRLAAVSLLAVFAAVVFVSLPGVIGTLSSMFTNVSNDPSALSRTDSYDLAGQFISQAPVFGRGFGTFLPRYRILDNQYLLLLIDSGVVGVAALIAMFTTAITCVVLVRRRSTDPMVRHMGQAMSASVASAAVSFAPFDAFSFPLFSGVSFLLVGLCGSLWRLQAAPRQHWVDPSSSPVHDASEWR